MTSENDDPAGAPRRPAGRFRRFVTNALVTLGALSLGFFLLLLVLTVVALRRDGVPDRMILELDLTGGLIEHVPEDVVGTLLARDELTLRDAVDALKRGEADDRVRALVARVDGELGMAQAEELRAAVASFRASGKRAVVFSETFGEFAPGRGGYYLATAFDEIHLQPSGDVGVAGFIAETPFVAGTLDRLGLTLQMEQRHEYKNALNTLTDAEMSDPQREATTAVVTSFYENLVAGIAEGRDLEAGAVRALIDAGPYAADEALGAGLVDQLSYRDEVYDSLRARVGGEFLFAREYLKRAGRPHRKGPVIALIFGTGMIQRGESEVSPLGGGAVMGSETVARAFRDAIEDDDVRAIVFRVDSPGGSYVASDAIWRETERARAAGKPVIVSMGSTAGSGGYFVAMGADRIVAHPSTITGSIGVYGGKVLIGGTSEKVGVTWDDVRVGGNATMWSQVEPYSPAEWAKVQGSLDRIYEDFTAKVARGRDLSRDSAHAIARGRIWSGVDARRIGLVDELGGFEVALRSAKEAAGIDAEAGVEVRDFPRPRSLVEMLLEPRARSSYPTGMESAARALSLLEPLVEQAQRTGLLGGSSTLLMPPLGAVR